jgi:hypothetical protein
MIIKQYIPELNYWFSMYYKNHSDIKINNVIIDNIFDTKSFHNCSFLKLLFCNIFECDSYYYGFEEKTLISYNIGILERINTLIKKPKIYECTENGELNLFELTEDDLNMLDLLLLYKKGYDNSTLNSSVGLEGINFSDLKTKLSQLIFIYLDLMINEKYEQLKNLDNLIKNKNLLDQMFEYYVINESHKQIKNWEFILDSEIIKLKPVRKTIKITTDILSEQKIEISDETPYLLDSVYIYLNNIRNPEIDKKIINDKLVLSWEENVFEDDYITIDFFVSR